MSSEVEARFVALMSELFQLQEAEELDFGIYRLIKRHNKRVREFLGEVIQHGENASLKGGELASIFDNAFQKLSASVDQQKQALAKMGESLGIQPSLTQEQLDAKFNILESTPALKQQVSEYRVMRAQLLDDYNAEADRTEVLNRLLEFYERHYQDGDFIVQRRYGKNGARYIKSTGEDTEFRWATEDMYYIKSGDTFTDYTVRLSNGKLLVFSVDSDTLNKARAELKPSDRASYLLKSAKADGNTVNVVLQYAKGGQTKGKLDEVTKAAAKHSGATQEEVARQLRRYIARNQSDYFIHKRLREALDEDLDMFIKIEVLNTDQLLASGSDNIPERAFRLARVVREVGRKINAFLGVLEDFQKRLWEKKKLVLETRYVITLDRVEKLVGKESADQIAIAALANKVQVAEWESLGLGLFKGLQNLRRKDGKYLPLPIDTLHFDTQFKWELLAAVSTNISLDDAIDGVAIYSDNWQGLHTIMSKHARSINTLYADPPYNTDAGPISYKNGYRKASWAAFIENRLNLAKRCLSEDGIACITIDDYQKNELLEILSKEFGATNNLGVAVIKNSPSGRPSVRGFRVNHEYAGYSGAT